MALTACNDYLDVDAPSSYTTDFIFESDVEANTALNGVYAKALSDETFGNKLYNTMLLNSDVDFTTNSNNSAQADAPRRFDVRSDAGSVSKLWNALYGGVEEANEFIYNLKNSSIYSQKTKTEASTVNGQVTETTVPEITSATQMMGEAKVLRAMFYHELLSYYGDVPFTLQATYETNNLLPDVAKRQAISDALIADLKEAAEYMYSDSASTISAPERISQEAAYAMIARLALQAGGYSLNHDENDATGYKMTRPDNYKDYYAIARDYTNRIISRGKHSLSKSYRDVFVDECNFIVNKGDDAIFELPFAKESTSQWGYNQGPAASSDNGTTETYGNFGKCSGGVATTSFYRFQFADGDVRRDYVSGLWSYASTGLPSIRFDYTAYNNKWSKLWNSTGLGATTEGNTGINFAYIRYTDVLLMFAEADNEINNGPTSAAKSALQQVRARAFRGADNYSAMVNDYVNALSTKSDFLKAVLDERKFEFAGENMRWKDLVRNNMYAQEIFYTFLSYYTIAESHGGAASYIDMVEEHEGFAIDEMPTEIFYCYVKNTGDDINFPNNSLYKLYLVNPYSFASAPTQKPNIYEATKDIAVAEKTISGTGSSDIAWLSKPIDWYNDGALTNQVLYSLYGYIRGDENGGGIHITGMNGAVNPLTISTNISSLPAVRYMLPYPEEAIKRSSGVYKNYYGY